MLLYVWLDKYSKYIALCLIAVLHVIYSKYSIIAEYLTADDEAAIKAVTNLYNTGDFQVKTLQVDQKTNIVGNLDIGGKIRGGNGQLNGTFRGPALRTMDGH